MCCTTTPYEMRCDGTGYYRFVSYDSEADRLIKKLEELIDEVKEFNASEKRSK